MSLNNKEKVIRKEIRLCPCCMEEHEVQTVIVEEEILYKGVLVKYKAEHDYCYKDEMSYWDDERQIKENWRRMLEVYDKINNK